MRYWDGTAWTDHVWDDGVVGSDSMAALQTPASIPSAAQPFRSSPREPAPVEPRSTPVQGKGRNGRLILGGVAVLVVLGIAMVALTGGSHSSNGTDSASPVKVDGTDLLGVDEQIINDMDRARSVDCDSMNTALYDWQVKMASWPKDLKVAFQPAETDFRAAIDHCRSGDQAAVDSDLESGHNHLAALVSTIDERCSNSRDGATLTCR